MTRNEYNDCIRDWADRLFTYALNLIGNKLDAEDVIQDVFGKLWTIRGNIEKDTAKSYLYKMVHNRILDLLRKRELKYRVHEDMKIEGVTSFTDSVEAQDYINYLFRNLKPLYKSLLLLRDYEGYSYDDIGTILKLNPSQVKVYLYRARKEIKTYAKEK